MRSITHQILVLTITGSLLIGLSSGEAAVILITQEKKESVALFGAKLRAENDKTIVNLVAVAHSLLEELVKETRKISASQADVQHQGANLIRSLTFPNGGYFWVDTFEGTCVVFLGSSTEGKPRLDARFKIFNGLWKERLPVRTKDDVGLLAVTFNRFLERLGQIIEKERAYWSLADKLALLAEAHDKNTSEHNHHVVSISTYLSEKWGFDRDKSLNESHPPGRTDPRQSCL